MNVSTAKRSATLGVGGALVLAVSVVPSGTAWRYKIYHRDSSGA